MKTHMFLILLMAGGLLVPLMAGSAQSREQSADGEDRAIATFAGGCFWCMQPPFDKLKGVISTTVGYTGGQTANPTYQEVSAGGTGHVEAIQIVYDPSKISYSELLKVFWHNIDPFDAKGQFCDKGNQYRSVIFYHNAEQKALAEESKKKIEESWTTEKPVATEILPASTFYPAEEYHQEYYRKNPVRYKFYRYGCGRDRRLKQIWREEK